MKVVVIGAGPHGLAVLAALAARESWPEHITVIDPADRAWCAEWDAKLARLGLDRLRSPQVHHPGPRPMQLRDLVEAAPAAERRGLRRPEAERAPTPLGMRRMIDALVTTLGPLDWVQGRATSVTPSGRGVQVMVDALTESRASVRRGASDADRPLASSGAKNLRPHGTAAARESLILHADAVVLAHNPSLPRIPEWASPLVARGAAQHASTVDVRSAAVAGREVLIVGGGLTAACLALQAARRGGHAHIVARRALRARPYDVDASWIGPRRLTDFAAASPRKRRAMIDEARDGGTIPPRTLAELRALAAQPPQPGRGTITIQEGVEVQAIVEAALHTAAATASPAPPLLWLATGFEQDIARDPLVAPLIADLDLTVNDGLPETSDTLRLGGAPIYVTGPYAALTVGPACRNLAGARPAAARIAAALAPTPTAA